MTKTLFKISCALIALNLTLLLNACSEPATRESKKTGITLGGNGNTSEVFEVTLDGCEYYYHKSNDEFGLAHKGNCSNPIHCHND